MTKNKILELKDSQSVCIILVKCYGGKISKLELKSLIFFPFSNTPYQRSELFKPTSRMDHCELFY